MTVLAVTLEESGLLGSAYFGENPLIPLKNIVGGINIDAMQPTGMAKDMLVIGAGASQLEDMLKTVLAETGRTIRPDPIAGERLLLPLGPHQPRQEGRADALRRQRHRPGRRRRGGGRSGRQGVHRQRLPQAGDEYADTGTSPASRPTSKVDYEVVNRLANSADWPNWYDGNEFKALRDAQRAE